MPYQPRPEQHQIQDWLDGTMSVSVLLVSGPGGQGKTRLAGHVATSCYEAGWAVAQAVEHSPQRPAANPAGGIEAQPLLVVVDYAERWRLPVLGRLVKDLVQDYPRRPLRVLLLARPAAGLWDDVAAELDHSGVDTPDPITLGELNADRIVVFDHAAAAFAGRLQVPTPPPPPAKQLADPGCDSPLSLHMAALAAVCATDEDDIRAGPVSESGTAREEGPPGRPEDLSRFLLRHERRHWIATEARTGGSPGREVLELLAVLATLLGPVRDRSAAIGLIRAARLCDRDATAADILNVFERLYPPRRVDPNRLDELPRAATLVPLRPYRLGEDLIGIHLTTNPHTLGILAELLAHLDPTLGLDQVAFRRCLIVLAAASARHYAAYTALRWLLQYPLAPVRQAGEQSDDTLARHFGAVLDDLEARERAVLVLQVFEGLSDEEAAATLALTPSAVRRILHVGLTKLADGGEIPQSRISPDGSRPESWFLRSNPL